MGLRCAAHGCGQYRFESHLCSIHRATLVSVKTIHTLHRLISHSAVFVAIFLVTAVVASLATQIIARMQTIYILLNILYVHACISMYLRLKSWKSLHWNYHCIARVNSR